MVAGNVKLLSVVLGQWKHCLPGVIENGFYQKVSTGIRYPVGKKPDLFRHCRLSHNAGYGPRNPVDTAN
jgi:hypothetical protein